MNQMAPPAAPWQVPRAWPGETVFIVAGGPSLADVDLEQLRGRRVITINRSFRLIPWADVLYFCDRGWWMLDGAEVLDKFTGEYIISVSHIVHPRINLIRNAGVRGLSLDPRSVKHGTNSGYQAINVAFHFGAARIVLLGYDMRTVDGKTHAHGGYGSSAATMGHLLERRMRPYFPHLVKPLADAGVEVLNATAGSALDCWPLVSLSDVL